MDKEFCIICGQKIKTGIFNELVYPSDEFKDGKACFYCSKEIIGKNMKDKGFQIKK